MNDNHLIKKQMAKQPTNHDGHTVIFFFFHSGRYELRVFTNETNRFSVSVLPLCDTIINIINGNSCPFASPSFVFICDDSNGCGHRYIFYDTFSRDDKEKISTNFYTNQP